MTPIRFFRPGKEPEALPWNTEVQTWRSIRSKLLRPLPLRQPVEVHLLRHGETETNARALITGSQDVALTTRGYAQAREAGKHLAPRYDLAFCSTLSRSSETLRVAIEAGHVVVGRAMRDPRLSERSLGRLESQPWQPVEEYARGDLGYAPEGGESYAEVARRILSFLLDLRQLLSETGDATVLVSGHMGPMRILAGVFEQTPSPADVLAMSFRNTEVVRFKWSEMAMPAFLLGLEELA